jgi:hypothetical protein
LSTKGKKWAADLYDAMVVPEDKEEEESAPGFSHAAISEEEFRFIKQQYFPSKISDSPTTITTTTTTTTTTTSTTSSNLDLVSDL